jgi:hypothetical protein
MHMVKLFLSLALGRLGAVVTGGIVAMGSPTVYRPRRRRPEGQRKRTLLEPSLVRLREARRREAPVQQAAKLAKHHADHLGGMSSEGFLGRWNQLRCG